MYCNICSSLTLNDFNNREKVHCINCGSFERYRLLRNYLYKNNLMIDDVIKQSLKLMFYAENKSSIKYYVNIYKKESEIKNLNILNIGDEGLKIQELTENSFDLIILSHIMDKVSVSPITFLDILFSFLKPGGQIIITSPINYSDNFIASKNENKGLISVIQKADKSKEVYFEELLNFSKLKHAELLKYNPEKKFLSQCSIGTDILYSLKK